MVGREGLLTVQSRGALLVFYGKQSGANWEQSKNYLLKKPWRHKQTGNQIPV